LYTERRGCWEGQYLLAVYTALVGLDGNELLTADGDTVGERVVTGGVGGDQGVDFILGELYRESVVLATFLPMLGPHPA
jgi:hypothetical protein